MISFVAKRYRMSAGTYWNGDLYRCLERKVLPESITQGVNLVDIYCLDESKHIIWARVMNITIATSVYSINEVA